MSGRIISANQNTFSTAYRLFDVAVISSVLLLNTYITNQVFTQESLLLLIIAIVLFLLFSESLELYRSWRMETILKQLTVTLSCWVMVSAILAFILFFYPFLSVDDKSLPLLWLLGCLILLPAWRIIARLSLAYLRTLGFNSRSALIIGVTSNGALLAENILNNPQYGIRFLGFCDDRNIDRLDMENKFLKRSIFLGDTKQAIKLINDNHIDRVYVAMPMSAMHRIHDLMLMCSNTSAKIHIIPDVFTFNLINSRLSKLGSTQTLSIYDNPINGLSNWTKRIEDLVIAICVLIIISVPMLAIALIIKLTSKGPVLFKQDRYGLSGQRIKVWKFRTMTVSDNGDIVTQATKGDARVTHFGAFLRKTSLDELPQFLNVIGGSMSVVGPRPHAVAHNEEYRGKIGCYMLRHKVKPGITGWAQINGWRGETETIDKIEKRVEYDLDYLRHWSILLDIRIVFLTIFKGFVGKNVY